MSEVERRHPAGPCEVVNETFPREVGLMFKSAPDEFVRITFDSLPHEIDVALANRLAACFNALEGIPTECVSEVVRMGLESFLRKCVVTELDRRKKEDGESKA